MRLRFIAHVWLVGAFTIAIPAQQPVNRLPADDLRLYEMFFHFHDNLSNFVATRKAQDPARGARMEQDVARVMKLGAGELPTVGGVTHALVLDLGKLQDDVRNYIAQAKSRGQNPDYKTMQGFDQRRRALLNAAINQLGARLSAAGWTGLRAYINNEYRSFVAVSKPSPIQPPSTSQP